MAAPDLTLDGTASRRLVCDCADFYASDRFNAAAARQALTLVTLKVCEGIDFPDTAFVRRYAECVAAGFPEIEGYQFGTNLHSGEEQWADFKGRWDAACASAGRDPTAVGVWLDCEPEHGSEMSVDKARTWLRFGRRDGYRVGLYGFESNLRALFPDPADEVGEYPLWLAWYGPDPAKILPASLPAAWRAAGFARLQYSDGLHHPADTSRYPIAVPGCGTPDRSCRWVPADPGAPYCSVRFGFGGARDTPSATGVDSGPWRASATPGTTCWPRCKAWGPTTTTAAAACSARPAPSRARRAGA